MKLSMQKKKRNHYVPQSYLRVFAADPECRKIWTFRKDEGDFELRPIKKVAVSFYLYAPKGVDGRDYSFEDKLATLESWFGGDLWKAATTGYVDLGDTMVRKALSLLTAVMFLRNPLVFELHKRLHRQMTDYCEVADEMPREVEIGGKLYGVDSSDWPSFRGASDEDVKRMWIDGVGEAAWLAESLMKMRWAILTVDQPVFITSDNPVSFLHPSLKFEGFANPETTISFPLSPTRVLCMDNRHSEPANRYYPLRESPGAINLLIWRNARASMFSHRNTALVCQEMCDEAESTGLRWQPGGWF